MSPTQSNNAALFHEADANAALEQVIALVEELSLLITKENEILARGLPASLSACVTRKHELADMFEGWVKQVAAQKLCARVGDDALRQRLLARVKALRIVMAENTTRLRAAIDASRRRIEAVMRAIRDQAPCVGAYGANGRVQDSRAAYSVRGCCVNA
jgi:hypothetical protein